MLSKLLGFKVTLIASAAAMLVGIYIGYAVLCPSTADAIVKQLKKDAPKVETIKQREQAKKVKYANFDKAVDNAPDTTGCSDVPDPALFELLYDPQYD